jgi:hypothetical protein
MATARGKTETKPRRAKKPAEKQIVAWKGFNADLSCKGHPFKVGESYTHPGKVVACSSGFHACEAPFDVWSYYDIGGDNRFCRVQLSGATDCHAGDSKIAAETIYIETEVTLGEMIRAGVKYEIEAAFAKAKDGDYARNASSGHSARNASSGHSATNASSGHSARNASSGHSATNASSGDYARNASSGDYARNASSGDSARNASSGHYATNASSGHSATNASSGHYARNEATGSKSVIAAAGLNSFAKGAAGTAIALPYVDKRDQIRFVCGVAGEDGCPADTWLKAENGKFVEVK